MEFKNLFVKLVISTFLTSLSAVFSTAFLINSYTDCRLRIIDVQTK
jgi:hypothetical protein